jgi:hypothetical protein
MEQPFFQSKALKEYDRALRGKRRSSWRDFCSSVEGMKPTVRLHKILAKDESYQIGGLRFPSGDFTDYDQEVGWIICLRHIFLIGSQSWRTQLVLFRYGKIVPNFAFGRRFSVELPPRCSCLSQGTLEILPSDGVIFYTAGRLLGCFRIP